MSVSSSGINYEHALSDVSLGNVQLRNRIFSSAHQTGLVHEHLPTDELLAYHRERAAGGIGAIFVEASAVHPSGLLTPHTIGAYLPEVVDPLTRIADAVHQEGSKLFVQLFHGGREQIATAPKAPALAPSAVPSTRFHVEPRALTGDEIQSLIDGYALSAGHMMQSGLDGVEISASHAYLPAQFFSKRSNLRTDSYGGELSARLRFLTEIIDAVRTKVGQKMAVGIRLAVDELSPDGLNHEECVEIANTLAEQAPIDFVSFVLGDSATFSGSSYIAPRPLELPNSIMSSVDGVRNGLPKRVKMLATTRILDLAQADSAVAQGLTDLVGMTRAHIADPHLVRKASAGFAPIPCIGCNTCIGHYHAGTPIACVTNISTGREEHRKQPSEAVEARSTETARSTAAIVGAGPAGVAAAIQAARHGQQVTLFERQPEIGGQLRVAGAAPDQTETWQRWKDWADRELKDKQISLRLNHEPTRGELQRFDRAVIASGATPYRQSAIWAAAAAKHVKLLDSWEVLENPDTVRGRVLIADWGGDPSGLDAAELLATRGHQVIYAYSAPSPGVQIHQYQRNGYLGRLDSLGASLLPHMELTADDDELKLRNVFSNRVTELPEKVGTIVAAHGRVPENNHPAYPPQSLVGDVAGPRSLEEATLEGTLVFDE